MAEPMTRAEITDRILSVSSFLRGYGEAAEFAARQLNTLMDDLDKRGTAQSDPEP